MKIVCKACNGKARIASRQVLSLEFSKLYCLCLVPHCGHQFVMNLTYSHATRPPAGTIEQLLFDRLRDLPRAQQRQLFDQLGAASV
ncbi:ogr/Delta-like zinc finger family protein [Pseudomonas sp. URMO17WK12:I2]|uniref:ogr/Delta-like zinc finger family protein n=1 Tax=Pseudomonas sp. URMO17WK12:I2 TaxID=1261623 RepID=UPI000DADA992|nr:ogr/Delta-like zinc finger family protein [Pseudomonas sp. URMO17WK12:I2]PZW49717.1 Ogr/Delta-like zinc finger protein [Pseudomonas sp. URMO17WK12:I2]